MKISQRLQQRQAPATQSLLAPSSSSTDVWLQRVAHLTSVGLLGLGVFGYFYTVLPVFQNQQLQEQAARLELEKGAAQRRLDELLTEQQSVQAEISALRESWQKERGKNAQLATNADDARKQEVLAKQRAVEAEGILAAQAQKLESARWELVVFDYFSAYMFSSLNASIRTGNKVRDPRPGAFIREQETDWPRPYLQLLDAVEVARKKRAISGQVPANYYSELQSFVESRRAALQCPLPDLVTLEASYQLQLAAIEPSIEIETKASIDKLVKEYADKGQRVEITDDYRQSVRKSVRFGKVFELDRSFDKRLSDVRKLCEDKATAVIEEFRKSKGVAS